MLYQVFTYQTREQSRKKQPVFQGAARSSLMLMQILHRLSPDVDKFKKIEVVVLSDRAAARLGFNSVVDNGTIIFGKKWG